MDQFGAAGSGEWPLGFSAGLQRDVDCLPLPLGTPIDDSPALFDNGSCLVGDNAQSPPPFGIVVRAGAPFERVFVGSWPVCGLVGVECVPVVFVSRVESGAIVVAVGGFDSVVVASNVEIGLGFGWHMCVGLKEKKECGACHGEKLSASPRDPWNPHHLESTPKRVLTE